MKKIFAVILTLAMLVSVATGCSAITDLTQQSGVLESVGKDVIGDIDIEIPTKDRAGNDIKVPDKIDKIISMAPSTTQVLIEFGLGDKIVGIDTNSATYIDKLPANVAQFDMMSPDNEAIAALSPDIVFTSGMSSVGGTSPFQSLIDSGVCVADIPSPSSIEGTAMISCLSEHVWARMPRLSHTQRDLRSLCQALRRFPRLSRRIRLRPYS